MKTSFSNNMGKEVFCIKSIHCYKTLFFNNTETIHKQNENAILICLKYLAVGNTTNDKEKENYIMNEKESAFYGKYAVPLKNAQTLLVNELQGILDNISTDPETKPSEHILSRIKNSESAIIKLEKKNIPGTVENVISQLSDVIGVRIVVHFVSDIFKIRDSIEKSEYCDVVTTKDYITTPKPNGYRSLHMILSVPFENEKIPNIQAEVQIRTIAQDCWASLEHQIRYKKNLKNAGIIGEELSLCAAQMASIDLTLNAIREMIANEKENSQ